MIQSVVTTDSSKKELILKMAVLGIGGLSRETGCPIETIRYYEKIGILDAPLRTENGHRRYQAKDVKNLVFILHARSLGFSIEDIRELIGLVKVSTPCEDIRQITVRHLEKVKQRISDLTEMASILDKAAQECDGGQSPDCHIVDMLYETRSSTGPQK